MFGIGKSLLKNRRWASQGSRRFLPLVERLEDRLLLTLDAVPDFYEVRANTELVVETTGVLANDTIVDGMELGIVTPPVHGSVMLNSDGSLAYQPPDGFTGEDSFEYYLSASPDYDTATVTITVTPNQVPAAAGDSYSVDEDGVLVVEAAQGVLVNDSDADGDPLTAVIVSTPQYGAVEFNADGGFRYIPTANFHGQDSFTYLASDGTDSSDEATVSITVNSVPDAPQIADDSFSTLEDSTIIASVADNDSDADLDFLFYALGDLPAHGTVALSSDGTFEYQPDLNWSGQDAFSYLASDGIHQRAASVAITVDAVNDPPAVQDDSYAVTVDGLLVVEREQGLLANDSDADGDSLTATLTAAPAHGALTLNADGSFTYTPDAGYHGYDSFTYAADDGVEPVQAAVLIVVNDAPTVADDSLSTAEDQSIAGDLAGNASDPNGDSLTFELATVPLHGWLDWQADGSFVYTPLANYHGPDSITYWVQDSYGAATLAQVSITIDPINDAPVAVADRYTMVEDGILQITPGRHLLANDQDVDGDGLTVSLVSGPAHGRLDLNPDGSFHYVPDPNYFGNDSFTYQVSDGAATAQGTATLVVQEWPRAVDDWFGVRQGRVLKRGAAAGFMANDVGYPLRVILLSRPAHGRLELLNRRGAFRYRPAAGFAGTDTFTYCVSNGVEASTPATVTISVNAGGPVNHLPTVTLDSSLVFSTANGNAIFVGDPDGPNSVLQLTVRATGGSLALGYTPDLVSVTANGSTIRLTGSLAAINQALDGLEFVKTWGPTDIEIEAYDGVFTDFDRIGV